MEIEIKGFMFIVKHGYMVEEISFTFHKMGLQIGGLLSLDPLALVAPWCLLYRHTRLGVQA
ncbi:NADH dehydrogenase subunit 4L [Sesbania bispinosa]|nr:NADH dehydrogenase subunit 4L [Sesbania bispinosa]